MDSFSVKSAASTVTTASAPSTKAAESKPWETGPLKPQFERSKSKYIKTIKRAEKESRELGEGFYASKIEMAAANVAARAKFYGYHTGQAMTMDVKKKLPNARLDLVVFMNVSGHDWRESTSLSEEQKQKLLQDRANDNSYNIKVTRPNGQVETMTGILAKGALFTGQDISITNMTPGKYIIEGWPDHSAAVGGYFEGRHVEINYAPAGDSFG
jgi:hypothetical protein